jgi:hypothetical protein
MVRKGLFVLLITVMLLMVMAFVVGTAGATIAVVDPKRNVSGYAQGNSSPSESFDPVDPDMSDYFQRHWSADSSMTTADPSDYYERHPESVRVLEYYMRLAGR